MILWLDLSPLSLVHQREVSVSVSLSLDIVTVASTQPLVAATRLRVGFSAEDQGPVLLVGPGAFVFIVAPMLREPAPAFIELVAETLGQIIPARLVVLPPLVVPLSSVVVLPVTLLPALTSEVPPISSAVAARSRLPEVLELVCFLRAVTAVRITRLQEVTGGGGTRF